MAYPVLNYGSVLTGKLLWLWVSVIAVVALGVTAAVIYLCTQAG